MKYWLNLFLVLALSSVFTVAKAQIPVRPYGQYYTICGLRIPWANYEGWVSSALIANCCY